MGVIERGLADSAISFARGVLDVGEPMAVPVIHQLKKWAVPKPGQVVIRDAPPGTSCPVVETVRGSDYLLLVTEPTPFGLHDLRLAVQVASALGVPTGVVINRENGSYPLIDNFCNEHNLPVLLRIPFDRSIAAGIAQGKTLVEICPQTISSFRELLIQINSEVKCGEHIQEYGETGFRWIKGGDLHVPGSFSS
jgi:MinD superfamily P-loop ATPase